VQAVYDTIVREDLKLVGGKNDREKVLGFGAGDTRSFCAAHLQGCAAGAGSTVVSISYVQYRDAVEDPDQIIGSGGGEPPNRVLNTARSDEVIQRLGILGTCHDFVDIGPAPISQKNGPGLGPERNHMAGPVVLLVLSRSLVLSDDVRVVFPDRAARGDAGLFMFAHAEP